MITVVVGQGPHVVQPIERINGKFVVFSEGNLVSNQGASTGLPAATQDGLIALLHFKAEGDRVDGPAGHLRPDLGPPRRLRRAPGEALLGSSNAGALRDSYSRTVKVVGKGNGFGPGL